MSTNYRLFITEVDFEDDYTVIKGNTAAYSGNSVSMEGEVCFIVKNSSGKCVISDWYSWGMDSPDLELRDGFRTPEDIDFWDNSEKYSKITDSLSINI